MQRAGSSRNRPPARYRRGIEGYASGLVSLSKGRGMSDLRSKVIRLAHARPDLRPALLPLLKESAPRVAGKPHEWLLNNPEASRLFNAILGEARKVDWEPYMVEAALDILEEVRSVEDIPRIYSHGPRGYYGIGGDRLQDMYEEKSNPFGAQRAPTLNLLLENPRIKGLIHKYIEAAEKTGVSAVVAAQWLDDKSFDILVNIPNPKIFIAIDDDNRDIAKAIKEIEENDEEYQAKIGQEEWAYNRYMDSLDRW